LITFFNWSDLSAVALFWRVFVVNSRIS